jgi:DMSO/TMAO reductase YedYZ molybdopterin-dependent catalytic subunit
MESKPMRIMSEKPLNAETPIESLRSWITANSVFFDRNQGEIPREKIHLTDWRLLIEGDVEAPLSLTFDEIYQMPKAMVANTLECSGNSRSLLEEKAKGNPWTVGGVGNAVWTGVWLRDVFALARPKAEARHVAFEGFDKPLGSAQIQFVRSIPLDKAISSTLLAYEMNGEPLPLKHGYPLRALALGWTGANCVKWLSRITCSAQPYSGFYMDKVYRVFQKGQDPETGAVVTGLKLKSIITQPVDGQRIPSGVVAVSGASYAGEAEVQAVEVSTDHGTTWEPAEFIGPREPYAWRHWQYLWKAEEKGQWTLMARAKDNQGNQQPLKATWNVLGYGNNGVQAHAVKVTII